MSERRPTAGHRLRRFPRGLEPPERTRPSLTVSGSIPSPLVSARPPSTCSSVTFSLPFASPDPPFRYASFSLLSLLPSSSLDDRLRRHVPFFPPFTDIPNATPNTQPRPPPPSGAEGQEIRVTSDGLGGNILLHLKIACPTSSSLPDCPIDPLDHRTRLLPFFVHPVDGLPLSTRRRTCSFRQREHDVEPSSLALTSGQHPVGDHEWPPIAATRNLASATPSLRISRPLFSHRSSIHRRTSPCELEPG